MKLERLVMGVEEQRKESSTTRSPRASGLGIASPLRNTPIALPKPDDQSSAFISDAVGPEPRDVGRVRAERLAVEEVAAPEHRMRAPEGDQPLREREQRAVLVLPVEPRDLVVLAVGVVVAALRAADLVAAEQHRDALREEQRGEEVALLARAELEHLGVVGRALGAAVPRAVVALAVGAALAVGLVVLLVVGDEVVEREAVVRGDEVDARGRAGGRRPRRGPSCR